MPDHQTRRAFVKQTAAAAASVTFATKQVCAGAPAAFRGKFSICNETFKDWAFDKAFAFAAEAGYAGTEIAPFTVSNDVTDISAARRREIRRQAEKAGLEVVGLHWLLARTKGLHLTSSDRAVRRKTTAYLGAQLRLPYTEAAEFAAKLQDATRSTEAEMMGTAFDIDRAHGSSADVLIVPDPDSTYLSETAIWGLMDSTRITNARFNIWRKRYRIEERL